jgi:hypothetical protein
MFVLTSCHSVSHDKWISHGGTSLLHFWCQFCSLGALQHIGFLHFSTCWWAQVFYSLTGACVDLSLLGRDSCKLAWTDDLDGTCRSSGPVSGTSRLYETATCPEMTESHHAMTSHRHCLPMSCTLASYFHASFYDRHSLRTAYH